MRTCILQRQVYVLPAMRDISCGLGHCQIFFINAVISLIMWAIMLSTTKQKQMTIFCVKGVCRNKITNTLQHHNVHHLPTKQGDDTSPGGDSHWHHAALTCNSLIKCTTTTFLPRARCYQNAHVQFTAYFSVSTE